MPGKRTIALNVFDAVTLSLIRTVPVHEPVGGQLPMRVALQ
jgi:hypothetical protein